MLTAVRIAVTAVALAVGALLLVLWIRSYTVCDSLRVASAYKLTSLRGELIVGGRQQFSDTKIKAQFGPFVWRVHYDRFSPNGVASRGPSTAIPHWLAVLVALGLAIVPWPKSIRRFSLRALMIALTLLAISLGMIAALLVNRLP